jgi:hypothetical protein
MHSHPALKTARILWFALFAATFMYMGVAYGILPKTTTPPQNPLMLPVFGGISLVIAVMSFLVPKMTYQQAAKAANVKIEEEVASSAFPNRYREAMPKRSVFAQPEAATGTAFACFQAPLILSLALSESIALFGLVLSQVGFEVTMSLPFFLAGAVLVAIRFPRQAKVLGMFEQVHGASFPTQKG